VTRLMVDLSSLPLDLQRVYGGGRGTRLPVGGGQSTRRWVAGNRTPTANRSGYPHLALELSPASAEFKR
jgi:hypothetical protein